jgi:hypothetical protein
VFLHCCQLAFDDPPQAPLNRDEKKPPSSLKAA